MFIEETYTIPQKSGNYLRFKDGTTKFRILSDAITGWLDRDNNKPLRMKEKPEISLDPSRPAKHFRAFVVWNYDDKAIQICEITQAGIQKAIMTYYRDEDWGDPKGYDLKVIKTGKELETKYQVVASNKSEIPVEILDKYMEVNPDLSKLFTGGNPFNE